MMDLLQFQLSGQQSIDFINRPENSLANIKAEFIIRGNYSSAKIIDAIGQITDQHEIFRISFVFKEGMKIPIQIVNPPQGSQNGCLTEHKLSLDQPVLIKLEVEENKEVRVFVTALPMVMDLYSIAVLRKEIVHQLSEDPITNSSDGNIQFSDYANWEAQLIDEGNHDAIEFWKDKYNNRLTSPVSFFSRGNGFEKTSICAEVPASLIETIANHNDVSEKSVLLALLQQSIYRYSEGRPLTICSIENGRVYDELKSTLGPLSRLIPINYNKNEINDINKLCQHVEKELQNAANWNDYYYHPANPWLNEQSPMVIFEYFEQENLSTHTDQIDVGPISFKNSDDQNLFKVFISKTNSQYTLETQFEKGNKIFSYLLEDLKERSTNPGLNIFHVNNLEEQFIKEFNRTEKFGTNQMTIPGFVKKAFASYPDQVALSDNQEHILFKDLELNVKKLVAVLQQQLRVRKGDVVGVMMENEMMVPQVLLALLFSGASYVPLDKNNPLDRLKGIVDDGGCNLVIHNAGDKELSHEFGETQFVSITDLVSFSENASPIQDLKEPEPNDTAYIIFTSGTTGKPKGCQIMHRNLSHYIQWANNYYFSSSSSGNFAFITKLGFDLTVTSIFCPLTSGKTIYCVDESLSLQEKLEYCFSPISNIDTVKLTPTHLSLLADSPIRDSNIKCTILGGEALTHTQLKTLRQIAPNTKIYNEYGPTEATVGCIVKEIIDLNAKVTIGQPIDNMSVMVVDENQKQLPVGTAGELLLKGLGLAKGYLKRPKLTNEKFIWSNNARYYRTGDLVRLLPEGEIEFLGRLDNQVKIRGNRIELNEIQFLLSNCDPIKQAIVLPKINEAEEKILIAFFTADKSIETKDLRIQLEKQLPEYMIPTQFIPIKEIPYTSNGKLDRDKLLSMSNDFKEVETQYRPPRNQTELTLTKIWQKVLRQDKIGILDNFFDLGGHSILALRIISEIRKQIGLDITVRDLFGAPTISEIGELISTKEEKSKLPPITIIANKPAFIPLSYPQERLWFIDQFQGSIHYHMPFLYQINGSINVNRIGSAFQEIINRHEVLRTVFKSQNGLSYQEVLPINSWQYEYFEELPEGIDLTSLISEEIKRPFDLEHDHMIRIQIIKITPTEYRLLLVVHHIAIDGWSIPLIIKELVEILQAGHEARATLLPQLPIQYADYAIWQRNTLTEDILEMQLDYWEGKLTGVQPLQMPTDFKRPEIQSTKGQSYFYNIDKQLSNKLKSLAANEDATTYVLLLSVFNVLLKRYTNQSDICVGTTVANRFQKELETLVGFFVNALAIRTNLDNDPTMRDLVKQVKTNFIEAYENVIVPFEKVVERIETERDRSRSSIFQVLFVLNNHVHETELSLGEEATITSISSGFNSAKYDLTFFVKETPEGIAITINYCSDLFKESTIDKMAKHYEQLLWSASQNLDQQINSLSMLSPAEANVLVEQLGKSTVNYPKNSTLMELFEERVKLAPEQPAISFEGSTLSFKELNTKANQLAHFLKSNHNIKPNDLVGIMMGTSDWYIVAMLAILKAGGAYVPIDISQPKDRRLFMINDAKLKVLIIESESLFDVIDANVPAFSMDIQMEDVQKSNQIENTKIDKRPTDLSYVIYTSGTTGLPKGVKISDQNLVDYLYGLKSKVNIESCRTFGLMSTLSADLGNTILYASLLFGGELHLFRKHALMNGHFLRQYFLENGIDCIKMVPSHWAALEQGEGPLLPEKLLIFGGDVLPVSVVKKIKSSNPSLEIINHYGPTETTIGKLLYQIPDQINSDGISIGKPFSNTEVYVVDQDMNLLPKGFPGELLIGGDGLSIGYLNDLEQTTQKFVSPAFNNRANKLYRTGDLVRWDASGNVIYLGRIDDQIKIRGYRVEISAVNAVLNQFEGILQGTVQVINDNTGNKQLVGYVVLKSETDLETISSGMKEKLPDYMVPSHWVPMEEIPLTANGKIDRNALPIPSMTNVQKEFIAPSNEIEKSLAEIWSSLLGVEKISVKDNFFELGGHSLLAIRVLASIRQEIGVELAITDIFEHPTIFELAASMQAAGSNNLLPAILIEERPEQIPLSYAQERLWFIDQLKGSAHYHLPTVFRFKGKLEQKMLEHALKGIIQRHEVLRTVYKSIKGKAFQEVIEADSWQLETLTNVQENDLEQIIKNLVYKPFDLEKDYMLKATLVQIGEEENILILVRHHIASDGWSVSLITNEFIELYKAGIEKREANLPAVPIQYADYALWQRKHLSSDFLHKQLAYWEENLAGIEPLNLPTDYPRPLEQTNEGGRVNFSLGKNLSNQLEQIAQEEGVTMFMLLLAVYKILLYRYSGQTNICVGTTVANRPQKELESLVGFFVNALALRSSLEGDPSFKNFLNTIKNTVLNAFKHINVPFEKVVDRVEKERDKSRSPLFQALFVLNNNPEADALELSNELKINTESSKYEIAKYDLTYFAKSTAAGISISINYSSSLFKQTTIERMKDHFLELLNAVVQDVHQPIGAIRMLTDPEKGILINKFGQSEVTYPKERTWIELFESQVQKAPNEIALVFEGKRLTYAELDDMTTRLAIYLQHTYQTGRGERIGIMMDTSDWYIIAIIGTMKAGAAYIPIDATLPKQRRQSMIEDAAIQALIIESDLLFEVIDLEVPIFSIDIQFSDINSAELGNINLDKPSPEDLAYLIYTSGTTGTPKGVMIRHQGLTDYLSGFQQKVDIESATTFGLMSALSADLGNTIWLTALANGKQLHLFSKTSLMDADYLHNYFQEQPIDCIKMVPSHWEGLEYNNQPLLPKQIMIFGGDVLNPTSIKKIQAIAPSLKTINHYGPTETTIGVLLHEVVPGKDYDKVPIGLPFSNTEAYIVNSTLSLCPVGVPGELLIGGDGLAKGYWKRDSLTKAKFIANPFGGKSEKLYKTGDLVQRLPNGELNFMGRMDDQVKIRGFRVELAEIESLLNEQVGINQRKVVTVENDNGQNQIVAYIVPQEGFDKSKLTEYLASNLPDYMQPTYMIELDEMPLNPNGKIDRKSLPPPTQSGQQTKEFVAPRNEIEEALAEIWSSVLNVDSIGIYDNFFELGGDSIMVIQIVSRARQAGYQLFVQDLFDYQTIAVLAENIKDDQSTNLVAEQGTLTGEVPLAPIQQAFLKQETSEKNHYNQAVLLKIRKDVRLDDLHEVIRILNYRHDALRLYFREEVDELYGGAPKWIQRYGKEVSKLEVIDLSAHVGASHQTEVEYACNHFQSRFNIHEGPLIQFILIKTNFDEDFDRLFIVAHHLVIDGVSWRILIDEMTLLLDAFAKQETAKLGMKTSSYRDWMNAMLDYSVSDKVVSDLDYWKNVVNAFAPLPTDRVITNRLRNTQKRCDIDLGEEWTEMLLKEVNHAYNTDINDLLLAALALTLKIWTGNNQIVIGLEGHGRDSITDSIDTTGTIGWFTNKYPVLFNVEDTVRDGNLIKSIKEQLRSIPEKGITYNSLRYLHNSKKIRKQLEGKGWDIVFNYLGQIDNVVKENNWFKESSENMGQHISPDYPIPDKIIVKGRVSENSLLISWTFSELEYDTSTIEQLSSQYLDNLKRLIEHCQNKEVGEKTPSDFGLTDELDYKELDQLIGSSISDDENGTLKF